MAQQQPNKHAVTYQEREYQVQEKPEEDLECRICLGLACDPCQTSCCGQTLCSLCTRMSSQCCPYCRKLNFQTTPDARIERKIRSLTAYCPNHDDKCNWMGSIFKVNDHLERCPEQVIDCRFTECLMRVTRKEMANHISTICPAQPMPCPNKCATGEKLMRSNLKYHLDIICPEQVTVCQFAEAGCTEGVKRKDIKAHIKICSAHPMTCPNHCATKGKLTRSTLQDHLEDNCPEQVISCPFAEAGCTVRVKRKEMADHIKVCPAYPVTCPNHCATEEKPTRSTLQGHLEDNCPEQVISCQFADSAAKTRCTVRVKRKEMAKHMVAHMSITERFLAVLRRFCELTVQLYVRFVLFTFQCISPLVVNYIGINNNIIIMIIIIILLLLFLPLLMDLIIYYLALFVMANVCILLLVFLYVFYLDITKLAYL